MSDWQPMETAPKDGRPIWFRSWDWGKPNTTRHASWAYRNGEAWHWSGVEGNVASFASEWLATPPPEG